MGKMSTLWFNAFKFMKRLQSCKYVSENNKDTALIQNNVTTLMYFLESTVYEVI